MAASACAVSTEKSEQTEQAASVCGPVPREPMCNTPRCTADGWVAWPVAAGAPCTLQGGGAGVCDGGKTVPTSIEPIAEGACVPRPPPVPEIFIPIDALAEELQIALDGTKIQVSHTTGTVDTIPEERDDCHLDPEIWGTCIEGCKTVACKTSCERLATKCQWSCDAVEELSYIAWGPVAQAAQGDIACNAATCPACPTATTVATPDEPLSVPEYSAHGATCRVNDWVFAVKNSQKVTVTGVGGGLVLEMHGSAVDPAIQCTNGPDMHVDSIGLKLTIAPSVDGKGNIQVSTTGELDTTFHPAWWAIPIDWFEDFDGSIKDGVKQNLSDQLNSSANEQMLAQTVQALITGYMAQKGIAAPTSFVSLAMSPSGLDVKYQR
jgi:hypothetical protein